MKIVKLPHYKKPLGKGVYGKYFQISARTGVKILGKGYKRIESLFLKFHHLEKAESETNILRRAQKSKISPRHAKLIIIHHKGRYYPAIQMQHIHGKTLWQINPYILPQHHFVTRSGKITKSSRNVCLSVFVKQRLRRCKIVNKDLHLNNIIINRQGMVKVIDFSPDQIKLPVSF